MERREFLKKTAGGLGALAAMPSAWAALDDGVTAQSVTFGTSLALSGPLGSAGKDVAAGMRAAFHAANLAGGVFGREIKLELRDDGYIPARTVDNVRQLVGQGNCLALVSCIGTGTTAAALPLVEQAGMPLIGPVTGAVSLRQPSRNVFHVRASYNEETARAVQQMVSIGLKDIAIVYLDNPFGKEVLREATAALAAANLRSVGSHALSVDGSNAAAVVSAVAVNKPGAVLLGTAGVASTQLVSALRRQMAGLPIVGLSVSLFSSDLAQLGTAAQGLALTQVLPDPDRARLAVARNFQASLKAAGETASGPTCFEGWVNAQVVLEGLRRAGRDLNRERLRQALASIRRLDLGDFSIGFSGVAPYVASNFVELAILGANGKRLS